MFPIFTQQVFQNHIHLWHLGTSREIVDEVVVVIRNRREDMENFLIFVHFVARHVKSLKNVQHCFDVIDLFCENKKFYLTSYFSLPEILIWRNLGNFDPDKNYIEKLHLDLIRNDMSLIRRKKVFRMTEVGLFKKRRIGV